MPGEEDLMGLGRSSIAKDQVRQEILGDGSLWKTVCQSIGRKCQFNTCGYVGLEFMVWSVNGSH
jgi:hypothetical protein